MLSSLFWGPDIPLADARRFPAPPGTYGPLAQEVDCLHQPDISEHAWKMMKRCRPAMGLLFCSLLATAVTAEDWPQWRGPHGDGISRSQTVPLTWGETRELAWKCPLPAWGASTPIVWNDSVFVTSHGEDGALWLQHIGAHRGEILWTQQIGRDSAPRGPELRGTPRFHRLHNLATPSPVTNGELVVVHFGNGDLAAYDFQGTQLWKRNLQADFGAYTIWYGHSNSPVISNDLVISICLQDAMADQHEKPTESYVVAHELSTGRMRWRTLRMTGAAAEEADSYTTPLVVANTTTPQLVVMGGNQLDAYDPRTGRQLWYLKDLVDGRTIASPTTSDGLLFATRGKRGALFAFPIPAHPTSAAAMERDKREMLWSDTQGTPDCCSPVAQALLLFTITDDGVARCYDTRSGKLKWKERLAGEYKASPVIVEGRVLFLNTAGLCTIVSASSRFSKLAENQLDDETVASPAIADNHIFIRGKKSLYCIGPRYH